ncbi:hypothetical protein DH2020_022905 [Rehmannia glutinosa]|uniref:Uncharacterized protein n=1 Tax=Rehmannia glutinosa TaxID=99300 RepID=A0ABR0W8I4_REHGL
MLQHPPHLVNSYPPLRSLLSCCISLRRRFSSALATTERSTYAPTARNGVTSTSRRFARCASLEYFGTRRHTRNHRLETDSRGGAPPTSPPPVLEEETVKEVLLETPIVVPKDVGEKSEECGQEIKDGRWKLDRRRYSESFSNATAQEKKDDDDDGVVNQRPPPMRTRRGISGGRGRGRGRGERVIARRAAAPSPEKRGQVAPLRPVRGRPMAGQPRNVAEENGRRRETEEDSGRRSRSPVKRGEVGVRRNEKSAAIEESRNAVVPVAEGESLEKPVEPPNDVVPVEEAESLENPVVSLECFIFL